MFPPSRVGEGWEDYLRIYLFCCLCGRGHSFGWPERKSGRRAYRVPLQVIASGWINSFPSGRDSPILLFSGLASVDLSMSFEAKSGLGCMSFPICNYFSMVVYWGFL